MRIIIRFSLNNDAGSGLRNALAGILEETGLTRTTKTATYEGDLDESEVRNVMRKFWNMAYGYVPAHIDHFWMYADQTLPEEEDQSEQEEEFA